MQVTPDRLQLCSPPNFQIKPLSAEFIRGPFGYRRLHGGGKNQAIAKAMGFKTVKETLTVLDATAGLGRDAFILASLGCGVRLIERSPVMCALLQDGLQRAAQDPQLLQTVKLMDVMAADAVEILQNLSVDQTPEVVYLDPMFPPKFKSALTKIEMRIIRDIVGEDSDADKLLALALQKAKRRVVVKRSSDAPRLLDMTPSFVIKGRSCRFDVYLTGGNIFSND